jgi:hypothetical protein
MGMSASRRLVCDAFGDARRERRGIGRRPEREAARVESCARRRQALAMGRQPVVNVWLHSTSDTSPLAALLLAQILPVFSIVAPCHRGASLVSVRRQTFTTGCERARQRRTELSRRRFGDARAHAAQVEGEPFDVQPCHRPLLSAATSGAN